MRWRLLAAAGGGTPLFFHFEFETLEKQSV
jgi:hypothetical protein